MFDELSLHILDVAMNSLAAQARVVQITVLESRKRDWLIVRIRDDGRGMEESELRRVLERGRSGKEGRKRPIGLGLALLRQTSEMCGGHFHVRSAPGQGTTVTASMRWSHVDRPPLGDLKTTMLALCISNPTVDVRLTYRSDGQRMCFSSQELIRKSESAREPQDGARLPSSSDFLASKNSRARPESRPALGRILGGEAVE
ncbi:MAG: sensor histidine kinase [Verrucomicrobia bacterium]|nr:sensor histidine kinase [Verrucomicrobiota bacterium]